MSERTSSTVLSLDPDDPSTTLESATWALAALVATLEDAATQPLADVLAANPQRTAVLEAAGLVRRDGDVPALHPAYRYPDGPTHHSAAQARLSSLRQAVAAAAGDRGESGGWADQEDEVLRNQGRVSAGTGRALAGKVVPALPGLAERLDAQGSSILDIGTGVAALALALAEAFPRADVVGVDVMERVLELAREDLAAAGTEAAGRVTLRHADVVDVAEQAAYDMIWLPAPFLPEAALTQALPRLVEALKPGAWIVAGTNPAAPDPLRQAVAGWHAVRNGGSAYDADRMASTLTGYGLRDERRFPTVPGGPVLVAARRD
ncbi:Methyltransferase domain-containing protein [Actinacidiphila yanglinensis]|uniref:Methyltransferase domain-containing protein n=1 Tax=Actinacidiphila yanglinensis TaxID=310779 RepID=A0A1H6E0F2_9ACTN|nr:class I SAM-dependent methyltransferase [Actinacidiphila yanglinensis]SEG90613.1 Methyltransferase domain-containing protein [Actinacidiphila yanglinensis]